MTMRTRTALLAAACLAVRAYAQSPAVPPGTPGAAEPSVARPALPDDPSALLDLDLRAAWDRFGPPRKVSAVRGVEPWQDDVAFDYGDGFAMYWFRDRLWQIRIYEGYRGSCFGIFLGDSEDKALSLLGQPDRGEEDLLEWRLPYRGYPVRLRLLTREGIVTEAYVYRSDF